MVVPSSAFETCLATLSGGESATRVDLQRTSEEFGMSYYFAKKLDASFSEAVGRAAAALNVRGFGVLTKIDVKSTLKEKIGADFRPYVILGAYGP